MTTAMEQLAQEFDTEEMRCIELTEKRDHARTFIGRAWRNYQLRGHQQELEQITSEFDVISLHGIVADEASMR
jgi:hypothetical protein